MLWLRLNTVDISSTIYLPRLVNVVCERPWAQCISDAVIKCCFWYEKKNAWYALCSILKTNSEFFSLYIIKKIRNGNHFWSRTRSLLYIIYLRNFESTLNFHGFQLFQLVTNSSDSFTNFVTTNLQFFLRKLMLLFTLTVHKNK